MVLGVSSVPLVGREVIGFFDDYRYAIGESTEHPTRAITNHLGAFTLRGTFDTYQAYEWWGHRCAKKPQKITFIVRSDVGSISRIEYRDISLTEPPVGGYSIILVPILKLER
jgi:hypothetical protein